MIGWQSDSGTTNSSTVSGGQARTSDDSPASVPAGRPHAVPDVVIRVVGEPTQEAPRPSIVPTVASLFPPKSMAGVVGQAPSLVDVYKVLDKVADTDCTVLITGESGTGKELVARAVHSASSRRDRPFVAVNCGAIPEALLESELFGHARGAFTGAHAAQRGRIAQAENGTLFLDEIGELPLPLQVKLLRVLQTREYSPVGDARVLSANVRIVAATNANLETAISQRAFREDLYYRLNVIQVVVPPLRARREDIPMLVDYFLARVGERAGRRGIDVSPSAQQLLFTYDWPGNVRELENAIERAALLCRNGTIQPKDLPARVLSLPSEERAPANLTDAGVNLRAAVESFENNLIRQALEKTQWNKNRAAKLLGLNRTTLVEMLKRKRIDAA